jgi:hypothetical protein
MNLYRILLYAAPHAHAELLKCFVYKAAIAQRKYDYISVKLMKFALVCQT